MTDQYGNNYPPQQPGQGQPQQPPYGGGYPPQPGQEEELPKNNRGLLWGSLGVGAAAIGGVVGFLVVQAMGDDDDDNGGTASEETENEQEPPTEEEENGDDVNGETDPEDNGGGEEPAMEDEVPDFEDIATDTFSLMQSAESLRLDLEGDFWGDEAEDFGAVPGETQQAVITGEPGGNLWMSFEMLGTDVEILDVGTTAYMPAETFLGIAELTAPPEFQDLDFSTMAADLDGYWMDAGEPLGIDIAELTQDFDLDEIPDAMGGTTSGELSSHDGQDVWVYSYEDEGEMMELAVVADSSEPYLVYVEGIMDGEEAYMGFSDWNSAEIPDEPSPDQTMSEAEFESYLMENM